MLDLSGNTNYSFSELLKFINEDFFDNIPTKRALLKFTRLIVDSFCEEKSLFPCTLESKRIASCLDAEYERDTFEISISRNYIKNYEAFKETKNFYFLFNYFNSVFHELRHHEQFVSGGKNLSPIVRYMARLTRSTYAHEILNDHSYSCNPLELDARYFAYLTCNSIPEFKKYQNNQDYVTKEIGGSIEDALDYFAFLKDENLRKVRGITKPLKLLENSVEEIAIKNKLYYYPSRDNLNELEDFSSQVNKVRLCDKIAKSIAPDFYSDEFASRENPIEVEQKIILEQFEFTELMAPEKVEIVSFETKKADDLPENDPVQER